MRQLTLYEQIYKDIADYIEKGTYKKGDKLPSEKELSERYCVSRITSKKALDLLADEGKIVRIAGKGSFLAGDDIVVPTRPSKATTSSSHLIGVILDGFGPSFGCLLLGSLEAECWKQGFSIVLRCSYGNIDRETKAIDDLLQIGVEGILIMCVHDENYNSKVLQLVVEHFPIVTIDRQLKGVPLSYVGTDNEKAARELTNDLLNDGYKKICLAMPTTRETSTVLDRQSGFIMALREHGMIEDKSLWLPDLKATLPSFRSEENLERDIRRITNFIESRKVIEAFFAVEYSIAVILYRCLRNMNLHKTCPVVCFDSSENIVEESTFTHVRQDEESIARISVQLLAKALNGDKEPQKVLVPYHIIDATQDRYE